MGDGGGIREVEFAGVAEARVGEIDRLAIVADKTLPTKLYIHTLSLSLSLCVYLDPLLNFKAIYANTFLFSVARITLSDSQIRHLPPLIYFLSITI